MGMQCPVSRRRPSTRPVRASRALSTPTVAVARSRVVVVVVVVAGGRLARNAGRVVARVVVVVVRAERARGAPGLESRDAWSYTIDIFQ